MAELFIPVDENLKSYYVAGTPSFRFLATLDDLSAYKNGLVNWHWQDIAELSVVTRGALRARVLEEECVVREGQGFVVLPGRLHTVLPVPDEAGEYRTLLFDRRLISGAPYSLIGSKYVDPLIEAEGAQLLVLDPGTGWMRAVLDMALDIVQLHLRQPFGYELSVVRGLIFIWHEIAVNMLKQNPVRMNTASSEEQRRVTALISFIHAHYGEKLSLADISGAAGVSRGECCRFFKRMLHMTPFEYLAQHRVQQSLELLEAGERSITEISERVGFSSANYFTTTFRRLMGVTPGIYRKRVMSK